MMRRAIAMPGQSKSPWYRTTARPSSSDPAADGIAGRAGQRPVDAGGGEPLQHLRVLARVHDFTGPRQFAGSAQLVHGQVGDQAQVGPLPHHRRPAAGAGRPQPVGDDGPRDLVGADPDPLPQQPAFRRRGGRRNIQRDTPAPAAPGPRPALRRRDRARHRSSRWPARRSQSAAGRRPAPRPACRPRSPVPGWPGRRAAGSARRPGAASPSRAASSPGRPGRARLSSRSSSAHSCSRRAWASFRSAGRSRSGPPVSSATTATSPRSAALDRRAASRAASFTWVVPARTGRAQQAAEPVRAVVVQRPP